MTDKERLEEIIEHVKKIESILYDKWQRQELTNLIESLYYAGHVDWLIEQAKEKIQLEERVEELEQEKAEKVEYWRKQHRKRCNELEDAYFKIQLIEIQNQRYREALEFYADQTIYKEELINEASYDADGVCISNDEYAPPVVYLDGGEKARKALEGKEK